MATAKRTTTTITKQVPAYQLTLTEGEADFLISVLAEVDGHDTQSPRKYANSIHRVLMETTGYDWEETDAYRLQSGAIHFEKYPAGEKRRYA